MFTMKYLLMMSSLVAMIRGLTTAINLFANELDEQQDRSNVDKKRMYSVEQDWRKYKGFSMPMN